jgi:V/A-type H+-transporting ATPase subunit K
MNKLALIVASVALLPGVAFAQEAIPAVTAAGDSGHWALALALLGCAMATALPCYGSAMGVSGVGQSGSGLLTEKPELAGKVITLAVLPGSQGLYGMVISLLFLFSFGPAVLDGSIDLSFTDGLALFAAFIPVAVTCFSSAPYQGKVCSAGMHMLARDGRLAGRVITLAALVETYALLGFLISFFMLNALKAGILS